jgi:hypothetical protein
MLESLLSIISFLLWTGTYYFIYYKYITSQENIVAYYQNIQHRLVPYMGFIVVMLILQFAANLLVQLSVCGNLHNIVFSFLRVGVYVWGIVLIMLGVLLNGYPTLKHIYSETIVHWENEANIILKDMFVTSTEGIEDKKVKRLIENLKCYFEGNEKKTCNIDFVRKINMQNIDEYLQLLSPILKRSDNSSNDLLLQYCIKKDIFSEMIWVAKIGMLIVYFLSLRSRQVQCLNYEQSQQEKIEEYIKAQQQMNS